MKQFINIILLNFGLVLYTACVNKNPASSLENETARRIFSKYTDNKGDNIYGIGKASSNKGSLQKDIAMAYAQAEIQKQISTHIDDYLKIQEQANNGKINTQIKKELTHKTIGDLRGAKIVDTYRGASGTLYILMKYNFKEYIKSISSVKIQPNFLNAKDKKEIKINTQHQHKAF